MIKCTYEDFIFCFSYILRVLHIHVHYVAYMFVIYDVSKICWSQLLTKTMTTKKKLVLPGLKRGGLINQDSKNIIKTNNLRSWDNAITLWLIVNLISKSCAVWSFHNYLILENWCVWVLSSRKNATLEKNLIFWDDQICEGLVYFLLQFSSRQSLIIQILFLNLQKRHKSQYTSQFLYKRMW